MASPQHVRAAPLARALRTRVAASVSATSPVTSRRALLGLSEPELRQLAVDLGQQSYRGKQLHDLLYKSKAKQIQEFSYVPKVFREALVGAGWSVGRSPVHHAVTASDGTTKILLKLEDNRLIETVGIPVNDDKSSSRLTACVSSQVGCPLRCSFCATGKGGFARNLHAHEIVEQVLVIEEIFRGTPMLKQGTENWAKDDNNLHSRCSQHDKMLASHKLQSTLAVSLHAPNQKLRETIVPSAKSYPLGALMDDCKNYFLETGRRVSFEYTLLAGINDTKEHAEELAELLHTCGGGYHVNLIPYNPIQGSEYKRPYRKVIQAFVDALEARKITTSVRQTRGLDANAACGQLRNEFQKNPLLESSPSSPQSEPNLVPA
ncbi:hypothetical protein GUJ93_ZPchr0007g3070 [Zizania palustris]|uniref:Radical SAM core domain-containing protein n=1 Tax=Zizania palustris TaxID=103762 RepID=A0A8J5TF67_ZIZPA|nr:hypothetical protein GUJ93_ZPchr0007g3070 [Zizania palustris]